MELAKLLEKKQSIVAVLGLSAFLGLLWTVGDGVVQYASYYRQDSQVLGTKTDEVSDTAKQCVPTETFQNFLTETNKTVALYAPNKTVTFAFEPLAACFVAQGCDASTFACADGKISLVQNCVTDYFAKYPLQVEGVKLVTGSGAVVQVQQQDWTVNYANLIEQLTKLVTEEIQYCQVVGQAEQTRQNLGSIQLVVSDELPSIKSGTFTQRFIEIDGSKEKVYFWNDGVYQALSLKHGARLPKEAIYKLSDLDLMKIMSSIDAQYLTRNSKPGDYVVIHE